MSIGDVRVIADKDYVDTSVVQYISKDDVLDDILENKLVVITDDESGVKQLLFKDKSKIRSGKTYAVLIEEVVAGNPVDTGEVDSEGNPIMEVPTLAGLGINGVSGGTNDSGSNSLIPTEDTAAPIISCNSTATAGTGVVVTISNYDNTKTYTFDKSGGSVSIVSSSGTFIWTMPIVSTNETHTIKVQASDNGSNPSTYSNVASVLVSNLLTLADDSMIFENATIVEDNFESTGGSLEGNTINAGTTIPALPESTNSSLVVESEIVEGQRVQVYYDSGDVERVIGSVTVSGTTNTHDIFGDGSAVATYNLDGNANDLGGNYNGTASNVTYETGKFGQCAVFDGSSGLIPLSNGAIVDVTNDYSISMWIKTTDTVSMNRFFDNVLSNGYLKNQVVIVLYNNDFRVYPISSDGSYTCDGFTFSAPTVENAWMHVVFNIKYDRTYNIYLNGINYAGTDVQNTYITSATTGTTLGKADGDYFNGQIDQVRIFNRALTQEEVTTLYNENVAKYTTPMTLPSKPTKIVTKDNIFESITFNHPLGYNWATNDVKLTLNKPRLNILSESTNLSLVTFNRISNGDKLSLLPEGGLETIDFPIGSVTAEGFGNFSVVTYTGNGSEQHIGTGINSVDFTVPYNGSGYWLARSGKHGVVVPLGASGSTDDVSAYSPTVIKDNGTYKMWYSGNDGSNGRIHYATSTDGINWDKHGVVVPLGASGSTDDYYVYTPTVIKDNGTYKMWYSGSDGSSWRTHYAELAGGYSLETHVVTDTGEIQDSGTCGWGPSKGVSKVHIKSRSKVSNHVVFDGLRGVEASISTNLTDAEQTGRTDTLGSFNEDGFTIKHHSDINANQATYVAYQTLYTHIKWGTTNHGKLYIEAYNPATKEGMIYYVGSGTAGHEIPHSMGIEIDLIEGKSLEDGTRPWAIQIPKQNSGRFVYDTDAIASYEHFTPITNSVFTLESGTTSNQNGLEHITYYKCKSETFTIGTYTGTGASGNFIETLDVNGVARKPRRVIIKRVDSANYWVVFDSERDSESLLNKYFRLDSNCVEATYKTFGVKLTNSGFEPNDGDASNNASGGQYLYLVEFETKYTTDISHLNLSEAPTTIFKDPLPKLETSVVADGADKNFEVREVDAVAVDGNNVVIDYSTAAQIGKNGSFRITSDDDTISKLNIDLTREG
jgi:hypothetical protein